jgi:hypothetical protein
VFHDFRCVVPSSSLSFRKSFISSFISSRTQRTLSRKLFILYDYIGFLIFLLLLLVVVVVFVCVCVCVCVCVHVCFPCVCWYASSCFLGCSYPSFLEGFLWWVFSFLGFFFFFFFFCRLWFRDTYCLTLNLLWNILFSPSMVIETYAGYL